MDMLITKVVEHCVRYRSAHVTKSCDLFKSQTKSWQIKIKSKSNPYLPDQIFLRSNQITRVDSITIDFKSNHDLDLPTTAHCNIWSLQYARVFSVHCKIYGADVVDETFDKWDIYDACLNRMDTESCCHTACVLEMFMVKRDILYIPDNFLNNRHCSRSGFYVHNYFWPCWRSDIDFLYVTCR